MIWLKPGHLISNLVSTLLDFILYLIEGTKELLSLNKMTPVKWQYLLQL